MNRRNKTKTRFKRRELVSDIYDKKVFSKNFRKYFDKSGMTVRKFLNIVGVGKSSFYNWLSHRRQNTRKKRRHIILTRMF